MTLRRRTAGALLAAAVVLAVATLPGPAQAAASVRLVWSSEWTNTTVGTRHIAGEVENDGTTDLTGITVTLDLRDAGNQVLDTVVRPTILAGLAPGERSPFGYGFTPPAGYDHHTIAGVTGSAASTPPNHRFTVTAAAAAADDSGEREVTGTVRNDNTAPAEDVTVALTFYGADDRVVGVAGSYPDDDSNGDVYNDLVAGQTKPYQATLAPGFPAFTRIAAVAQSPSALSPAPGPSASASASPSADPSPSPSTSAVPSSPPASPTASPTPDPACAPGLALSTNEITVGTPVDATVTGTPGARVVLEAYSRPVSTYAPVRPEAVLGGDGTAVFTVGPATNTRLRVVQAGCDTESASQLLRVHPVLTFAVRRDGTRRYTFDGRILPGAVNAGRAVALVYQLPGAAPVRRALLQVQPDGRFSTTIDFTGSARVGVWMRTGADSVNEDAVSNPRSLLVY